MDPMDPVPAVVAWKAEYSHRRWRDRSLALCGNCSSQLRNISFDSKLHDHSADLKMAHYGV